MNIEKLNKLTVVQSTSRKVTPMNQRLYKVIYDEELDTFYVELSTGRKITIEINANDLNYCGYLYAKPCNDVYDTWHRLSHGHIRSNPEYTAAYWSIVYHGMMVKGTIIPNGKRELFVLDFAYLNSLRDANSNSK